mmetsp:Transcript_32301/g.50358  ORF Transcript_32301/g.50358 Transcript_32301/m.50358 type:complete len:185 (-) Transcript_32301:75-629(-)
MDIVKMFNKEFQEFAKFPDLDIWPAHLEKEIEEVLSWIYPGINDGVYRCGLCKSQEAYNKAIVNLYGALDRAEEHLSKQRWLCGNQFTIADLRLFMTLYRFDEVYVVYFKCNKKRIDEYPNLYNYCKDIYTIDAVRETMSMDHIKKHYFSSHPWLNTHGIIPVGTGRGFDGPHDRTRFDDATVN